MKATILTNVGINSSFIYEIRDLTGFEVTKKQTDAKILTKVDPLTKGVYGDFDWIRSLFTDPTDIRCYVTSREDLIANHMTDQGVYSHVAAYDIHDTDKVYDFYIGLASALDERAKVNGFKSNIAWEFIHEWCHGAFGFLGKPDYIHGISVVHSMEEQGKLKQLFIDLRQQIQTREQSMNLLASLLNQLSILKQQFFNMQKQPFFEKYFPITQAFGVKNPIYTQTGTHIGTDFATPISTPLIGPDDGTLKSHISIETGVTAQFTTKDGRTYEFLHLSHVLQDGEYKKGEQFAYTGNTGTISTGAHCCVRLWRGKPNVGILTKDNINTYLMDVTKV